MPSKVTFTDGSTITYVYAADGTKLRTVHNIGGTTTTTDYCGNVVYENGTQKYLLTEEGYVTLADNKYHYYLQDHQGNNRVVIASDGTVEEVNHYYPFGGTFAGSTSVQPYKYNGKELDTKNGLNWYDYGARHYDPALGRFVSLDPLAKDNSSWSPYSYCYDSPVKFIDPDGKDGIISIYGNNITISSNIILTGPHATSQLAGIYKAGIMNTWGKQTSYEFQGKNYNVSWDINVRAGYQGEERTFNGSNNYMEVRMTNKVSGVADSNWGYIRGVGRNGMSLMEDNPMPHEFGHMLGLKDHYHYIEGNGNNPYLIDEGWDGNIMAAPAGKGLVEEKNLDILLSKPIQQYEQFIEMNKDVPWVKYMKRIFSINQNNKE